MERGNKRMRLQKEDEMIKMNPTLTDGEKQVLKGHYIKSQLLC